MGMMAMATTISIAILELSAASYDEIERKLLEAGYDHLFARGPGTGIDMSGIEVQRAIEQRAEELGKGLQGAHAIRKRLTFKR